MTKHDYALVLLVTAFALVIMGSSIAATLVLGEPSNPDGSATLARLTALCIAGGTILALRLIAGIVDELWSLIETTSHAA